MGGSRGTIDMGLFAYLSNKPLASFPSVSLCTYIHVAMYLLDVLFSGKCVRAHIIDRGNDLQSPGLQSPVERTTIPTTPA